MILCSCESDRQVNISSNTSYITDSCHPEHLFALSPCWECGYRSLTFIQSFKTEEKISLVKVFWDMLGKRNWVAAVGQGSPPRRLGAEQGNRSSQKVPFKKKCHDFFF